MMDKRKAEAVAAVREEIARRIARFCASLSDEEFGRLVDRMAQVQWKYDVLPLISDPPTSGEKNRELTE